MWFNGGMYFRGVPDDLIRKHYDDLCHGDVALNVFSDGVAKTLFPNDANRVLDYVSYLVNKRDERISSRIARFFLDLSDAVLDA